ncbi:MAG: NDP-sugar synthase [Deltaproteobacteria bacterium]|nr:NDP-sugar synthase [Deltaproteobacteria bacterium]
MTKPQAMVLAAGLGTRLWPLTDDVAKPAVPFLGRPLIDWVIALLARHGIDRAVVNTHHRAESVREALEASDHGVRILYSHEEEILGTAGALERASSSKLLEPDRPVLIINAKLFTDFDLGALWRAHQASGALVTMGLRPNAEREAFREVLTEADVVTGFGEGRVPKGPSPLLFTGIHVLEPAVVASIGPGFSDTVSDVYPRLIEARRVFAHVEPRGRWWEFSTLSRYLELHRRAVSEGLWLDPAGVIGGPDAVEPGAEARRCVLWPGARVERGAFVEDAILGRDVVIRSGRRVSHQVVVRSDRAEPDPRGRLEDGLLFAPID